MATLVDTQIINTEAEDEALSSGCSGEEEGSLEDVSSNEEEGEIIEKPKKERKPPVRKPWTPVVFKEDEKHGVLMKGPMGGIYAVKTTKNGRERKYYMRELNVRHVEGAEPKRRKKRAALDGEAEPDASEGDKRKAESEAEGAPKRKRVRKALPPGTCDDFVPTQ
jgi:hypothetical protein